MTTKDMISQWFDNGIEEGASYMIVVCDTFDYEDYPVFVAPDEDVDDKKRHYANLSMQKVMEVYDLCANKQTQLARM